MSSPATTPSLQLATPAPLRGRNPSPDTVPAQADPNDLPDPLAGLDPEPPASDGPQAQGDLIVLPWPAFMAPHLRAQQMAAARPLPAAGAESAGFSSADHRVRPAGVVGAALHGPGPDPGRARGPRWAGGAAGPRRTRRPADRARGVRGPPPTHRGLRSGSSWWPTDAHLPRRRPPGGRRPGDDDPDGLPAFRWLCAPVGLGTRRQLAALGLRPGGAEPVARIVWRKGSGSPTCT